MPALPAPAIGEVAKVLYDLMRAGNRIKFFPIPKPSADTDPAELQKFDKSQYDDDTKDDTTVVKVLDAVHCVESNMSSVVQQLLKALMAETFSLTKPGGKIVKAGSQRISRCIRYHRLGQTRPKHPEKTKGRTRRTGKWVIKRA